MRTIDSSAQLMALVRFGALIAASLLAAGCGEAADALEKARSEIAAAAAATAEPVSPGWNLQSSGEGAALVFPDRGAATVRLFCPAASGRILVNVPGFRPIGSEERLSFGSGSASHALVADTRGDRQRGGVSGTGAVPDNLVALVGGPISVTYGALVSGPHPAPPADLVRAWATDCAEGPAPTANAKPDSAGACLMQDGKRLTIAPLRAVGTEPFWGAQIEGRCVTYSTVDDQRGDRVWTRYTASASGGGTWSGALGGRPFVLRTQPEAGCSDGMSDRRYPLAVTLTGGIL